MRETCLIGSLRFHAPSHGAPPHVVDVVATSVEHRDADRLLHEQRRRVEEARQRCGVLELRRMVGRQNQRRAARHGQADNAVARHRDLLVGGQPQRKLTGEKRLPFIGIGLLVEARGRIPVGVEAGLAADGHHGGDAGLVEPLERRGVDVPAAVVVLRTHAVEEIHGLGPARAGCRRRCASGAGCRRRCASGPDVRAGCRRRCASGAGCRRRCASGRMSAPAAPPGWNCTRMLRPIAVEYTSRYSTGKPSRENAFAFGTPPTTTANAGSVSTAAAIASRRRSRYCTALTTDVRGICCSYRPFACPRRINGGLEMAIAPTWLRRYQTFRKPGQLTNR